MTDRTVQVNTRVPVHAKDVLLRTGARLRDEPVFAEQLARFLATLDDPVAVPSLAERVRLLEARIDRIEGR